MSYIARITQNCPTAIVLLVDQSGSMNDSTLWHGLQVPKSEAVAEAINQLLAELVARSKYEGGYRNYYDIAVLGYSGSRVYSLLPTLPGNHFMTTEQLAGSVLRTRTVQRVRTLSDGRTLLTAVEQDVWVTPRTDWNTPMIAAMDEACRLLSEWVGAHAGRPCYPPTVINITDGEATDGSPDALRQASARIRELSTVDGAALLLNIHLGHAEGAPLLFPSLPGQLPPDDRYARLLYDTSSPLPPAFAREIGAAPGARGMAYNADMSSLVRVMNIGTSSSAFDPDALLRGELSEGLRAFSRGGLYGYENESGEAVVEPFYDWCGDFSEGRAAVQRAGLMGLIGREGRLVVPLEYDDLSWDGSRYAYVEKEGRCGCLDRQGAVVVPLEYDWMGEFSFGRAVVMRDDRCGYVSSAGGLIDPGLAYDDAGSFAEVEGFASPVAEVILDGHRMIIE